MKTLPAVLALLSISAFSADTLRIHEWGVVELDREYQSASGALKGNIDGNGNLRPMEFYEVEAPVVWFHGPSCSGDFTVTACTGIVTAAQPLFDEDREVTGTGEAVCREFIWHDLVIGSPENEEEEEEEERWAAEEALPEISDGLWYGFEYAVPHWRSVGSASVHHPSTGYNDGFLYYECSFRDMESYVREGHGCNGVCLIFTGDGNEMKCSEATAAMGNVLTGEELAEGEILEILMGWSGDELLEGEIVALWNTWEPALGYRCLELGERVMVFPLTDAQVNDICTIDFQPESDIPVEYYRLFLGMGQIP